MNLAMVSLTIGRLTLRLWVYRTIGYGMQYLGLTPSNERGNGFLNGRQVDIAVMGISLRSVMTCSTLV